MRKIRLTQVGSIKMENNELIALFDGDAIIMEDEEYVPIEDLRFQDRPLTQTEITYKLLLIKRNSFPDELIGAIPRLGDRVAVVDYKTGTKVYSRVDSRQYRIAGLNSIWKKYPSLKAGDIIRMALNPITKEIVVDFNTVTKSIAMI